MTNKVAVSKNYEKYLLSKYNFVDDLLRAYKSIPESSIIPLELPLGLDYQFGLFNSKTMVVTYPEAGYVAYNSVHRYVSKYGSMMTSSYCIPNVLYVDLEGGSCLYGLDRIYSPAYDTYPILRSDYTTFPKRYSKPDLISFMGLPSGSIIPTKNGRGFEVVGREFTEVKEVQVSGSGLKLKYIDGTLFLKPLDELAKVTATKSGWGSKFRNSIEVYEAPFNLASCKGSYTLDKSGIRMPFVRSVLPPGADPNLWRIEGEVTPFSSAIKLKAVDLDSELSFLFA